MTKRDEYAFWVMRAITAPNNSNMVHFYYKKKDELFSLLQQEDCFHPAFRNMMTERNEHINNEFVELIIRVLNADSDVLVLPRLTLNEKKDFFNSFLSKVKDATLKEQLQLEIDQFSDNDEFYFKTDFRKNNWSLFLEYDMTRGEFIVDKVESIYQPLGISVNSTVVW